MSNPGESDPTRSDEDEQERSAEARNVVAPTPGEVRAKAENDGEPEPSAADHKTP
ncbi:hypothetical protein ACFVZD_46840 [Streptomyces sp. NPDC058287]|uniref:hypothetical protein n=1 Tax=unclassified Streptomyces TaxID=2593676 RepID=UPI0036E17D0D